MTFFNLSEDKDDKGEKKKKDVSTQGKDMENTERNPKAGRTFLSPQLLSADSAFTPQREQSVPRTALSGAADCPEAAAQETNQPC